MGHHHLCRINGLETPWYWTWMSLKHWYTLNRGKKHPEPEVSIICNTSLIETGVGTWKTTVCVQLDITKPDVQIAQIKTETTFKINSTAFYCLRHNWAFFKMNRAVKAVKSKCLSPQCDEIHLQSFFASKDGARKTELFAYVISRKRSANEQNQLRNDAFHVKTSQSAKN